MQTSFIIPCAKGLYKGFWEARGQTLTQGGQDTRKLYRQDEVGISRMGIKMKKGTRKGTSRM
jgi:hypothetical protein